MSANLRLHHIGILVGDIAKSSNHYVDAFGYQIRSDIIHDPQQMAFVRFFALPGESHYIELISPDKSESHLHSTLKRGGGIHHSCLITNEMDATLSLSRRYGAIVVRPPAPAVAFGGCRIAWIINHDNLLIEFVESPALLLKERSDQFTDISSVESPSRIAFEWSGLGPRTTVGLHPLYTP